MSGILMMQKENNMDEIIRAINHALDCAKNRLQWYSVVGDDKLVKESIEWVDIANMYMNELIMRQKSGSLS
jgi:endonuclease V-like protein UPF0215 family